MDLEIQNIRKLEHLSIKKFSTDFTNMRQIWQSVTTISINVLGMVHTKHFVHSPLKITFCFKLLISPSKFIGPLEFEIMRVACTIKIMPDEERNSDDSRTKPWYVILTIYALYLKGIVAPKILSIEK